MLDPIKTIATNRVLGAPPNWDESAGPCIGLPCYQDEDGTYYSWWKVSWIDRLKILFGSHVRLAIMSAAHPPVALEIYKADQ